MIVSDHSLSNKSTQDHVIKCMNLNEIFYFILVFKNTMPQNQSHEYMSILKSICILLVTFLNRLSIIIKNFHINFNISTQIHN